jgi:hypothetical protein
MLIFFVSQVGTIREFWKFRRLITYGQMVVGTVTSREIIRAEDSDTHIAYHCFEAPDSGEMRQFEGKANVPSLSFDYFKGTGSQDRIF